METKEKIIKARNILSEVFNENKLAWCEEEWMSHLCHSMGSLDLVIKELIKIEKNENSIQMKGGK